MSKLVGIKTYERFRSLWENDAIDDFSLNFIIDTGQLYTHGIFINGAVFGTAANDAVPLSIAGITNTLALSSHTHSNYLEKNVDIDISNYKIKSGDKDLLFYSGGSLYLGNDASPTYISGSNLYSVRGNTVHEILDTSNFSISNTLPTGYTYNNTAYIRYGSNSHQIDYVKRINTSQSFDYLNTYTQAGTNILNGIQYGYITLYTDNVYTNPSWAQLRINIPNKVMQFRTSADPNNWIGFDAPTIPNNALNVAGIVAAPSSTTINKVWKTDGSGNPAWRDETSYTFSNLKFQQISGTDLMTYDTQATKTILAGSNISFTHDNGVLTIKAQDTTYGVVSKTSAGLAPQLPNETTTTKFLRQDGTWATPTYTSDTNTWRPIKVNGTEKRGTAITSGDLNFINGSNTTVEWTSDNKLRINSTWTAWKGATDSANGTAGYMPAPTSAQRGQFLRGDGSWVSLNNYSLPTASNTTLGGVKTGAAITDTTGYTAVAIKDGIIYYKDTNTTYTFYNLQFQNSGGTTVDTYKPTTSPTKTLKAGSNVTISASSNVITIASTDTNTWRGIQNNLTSDSTTDSLSAAQGKALANGSARDSTKLPLAGGTMTGSITMSQGASARNVGIIGTYDYTKAAAIWTMGASYQIPAAGNNLGSLYGAAYVYQGQAGQGVMAGGHQFVWAENGVAKVALGNAGVWTTGGFKKNGSSDSYVLLGGGGHKAVSDFATSGHNHNSSYVASVSISGNNLRINKNGANTDLTIPYATNAGSAANASNLISNTRMDYGWNGINYFNHSAANQSKAKVNDTPYSSATWTHILRFNHANNAGYYTDLAIPFNGNGIYYKRVVNGGLQNSTTNGGWVSVLDNLNSSVSKSGETLTVKINGTSQSLTNTNTWRGIQNNLTSTSTTDSLSAAQGKALNDKFRSYLPLSGGTMTGNITAVSTASSWLDGQRYNRGIRFKDATDTGSYWPWLNQTNTGSGKWFSLGILNTSLYIIGSSTSRTENSYDYGWRFDLSNGWAYGNFQNADTTDGLHVHGGRNNEANKIVRTDGNGYIQCGYINSSSGDENNNSSPARVWGTNGSDSYLRTYRTSALSVNYATSSNTTNTFTYANNWNVSYASNKVNFITCGGTAASGAPGGYYSGVSFMTSYVGFQLVTYGGPTENLLFRKLQDNNSWKSWRTLIHDGNIGSQSVNYANSAGSVAWSNITGKPSTFTPSSHTHNYLPLSGGSLTGLLSVRNTGNTAAGQYNQGAMQIREYNYGGSQSDTWGNAPRLTWHWSGRVAAQIGLASNGYLYEAPATGTNFYRLVYESGTWGINVTGSAGSVAWSNVSGRPTNLNQFTNGPGYITSSGSCSYATTAGTANSVAFNNIANNPFISLFIVPNQTRGTGINVNAREGGRTLLILMSGQCASGNDTTSRIYMVRCGYSGNNYNFDELHSRTGTCYASLTASVSSSGELQLKANSGQCYVAIYQSRFV